MPLMHSAMVACSLYLLTGCICSQWPDLAHVLLAHPKMGKNTTSNSEANKTRALWGDPSWTTTFCNLCAEEIEARDKGIFAALSAKGWSNLVIKVCDETGLNYDKEQLKCRWDVLKANWRVWNKLKGLDTNLGWDAMKETIDASDDWWDMKLKVDVFMDAAFGAVLVAIRFLDIKLSAQYPVSCMKSNLTAEQIVNYLC
ncbi:uncharacterized protein LOC115971690 isoform X2 [Quercus lobata]|uniref:uncharacterized protein LOC115971690 isoform X2 n=1 Tax=Quercus lobata TaxID=97700 RepID=UPI001246DA2B|nr:uncharacterized protein LOC115971690 isoform X2 [Quercus lobata]